MFLLSIIMELYLNLEMLLLICSAPISNQSTCMISAADMLLIFNIIIAMNFMKKRIIFLGLVLMLGLTGCYDLD